MSAGEARVERPDRPVTEYCRLGGHSTCTSRDCGCRLGSHVIYHEWNDEAAPSWRGPTRNLRLVRDGEA